MKDEATPRPWKQDGMRIEDAQGRKVASGDSMDIRPIAEALANTELIVTAVNERSQYAAEYERLLRHAETLESAVCLWCGLTSEEASRWGDICDDLCAKCEIEFAILCSRDSTYAENDQVRPATAPSECPTSAARPYG